MPEKEKVTLTFSNKVREQLEYLIIKTNATSFAEVVRKGLDLLQKQVEDPIIKP